jgi:hypothetical protein
VNYFLATFTLYIAVGAFVCTFVRDKDNHPAPIHHYLLLILVWPVLFLLDHD